MRGMYSERIHGEYDSSIRELKRSVVERIKKARANGVAASAIADAGGDGISIHVVYDMLNAELFPKDVWVAMDKALKSIGY